MSALILSALFGVMMMFSSFLLGKARSVRILGWMGMAALLVVNLLELLGMPLFTVNAGEMMHFDRFALIFNSIVFASTLAYFLLSSRDMVKVGIYYPEYFALIFFIMAGVTLVSSFKSLLILFLGVEIISIPLYILTGSDKKNLKSNEASLKYFLLGSFSTGLMLMGIALVYGAAGTFSTAAIGSQPATGVSVLMVAGMCLLIFSMAFKASVAPFHFWTPDVYDGAPTVFTSFMATIVKVAVFIGFIRLFEESFGSLRPEWQLLMAILAAVTLLIGNLTAVFQQSVKRMLAYSSIAQAGFMMLAVFALNTDAKEGILLYSVAYCIATIGIFAVLTRMQDYTFGGFNGFARHQPLLAATLVVFLLSLAGIPLTAGFIAKFYMIKATLATGGFLWLVIFAVLMAAVSVYYYFRLIQAMYFREPDGSPVMEARPSFKWTMVLMAAIIVILGVFPDLLLTRLYF